MMRRYSYRLDAKGALICISDGRPRCKPALHPYIRACAVRWRGRGGGKGEGGAGRGRSEACQVKAKRISLILPMGHLQRAESMVQRSIPRNTKASIMTATIAAPTAPVAAACRESRD